MVFSKKMPTEQLPEISVAGVYNLWDVLTGYYDSLEYLNIFANYAHDPDLKLKLNDTISDITKRSQQIEKLMARSKIRTPDLSKKDVHTLKNPQIIDDQQIGKYLLFTAQERIEMKARAVRNSQFNDNIREFFMKLLKVDIGNIDAIVKYVKLKGWLEQPPLLLYLPEDCKEEIDVGEAYHLWDHLVFRYLNIEQTQIFFHRAHDGDFKLVLNRATETLKKQAQQIEKEIYYFGLPYTKRSPVQLGLTENDEYIDDDFIYNILLQGLQSASIIHAQAFKKATTNERIRKLFGRLLVEEIESIDALIKYGKLKGWLISTPVYRMQ